MHHQDKTSVPSLSLMFPVGEPSAGAHLEKQRGAVMMLVTQVLLHLL